MICEHCGKDKEDVTEKEDPYLKEIEDTIVLISVFEDCYLEIVYYILIKKLISNINKYF